MIRARNPKGCSGSISGAQRSEQDLHPKLLKRIQPSLTLATREGGLSANLNTSQLSSLLGAEKGDAERMPELRNYAAMGLRVSGRTNIAKQCRPTNRVSEHMETYGRHQGSVPETLWAPWGASDDERDPTLAMDYDEWHCTFMKITPKSGGESSPFIW